MSGQFQTFLFDYRHEGETWVFKIVARDAADARQRIKSLANAHLKGRSLGSVPAATWGERIAAWIRNAMQS